MGNIVEVNGGADLFTLLNNSGGHMVQGGSSGRIKGYTQLIKLGNNGD